MRLLVAATCAGLLVSCAWFEADTRPIRFVDEAAERGLTYAHIAGGTEKHRLPEIMGGGVALLDSDRDGDLDVYFVQSGSLDEQPADHANEFFLNDGSGRFERVDAGDASENLGYGMGVAVGDVNGDALPDLFVTQLRKNVLLLNQGNNAFKDITEEAGFELEDWSTATAFADFDRDGDLDLWVVNYIEWSEAIEPECYQKMLGSRDYCSPSHYDAPAQDRVFRNDGKGRFVDVTGEAGVIGTKGNGLGIVTTDFNGDGLLDVFVANDTHPNHLWLNQGNFRFIDEAALWNCAVDQHGVARAGMGIVATDLDGDEDQDVIIGHITTEADYVFSNQGEYFRDVTAAVGLSIYSRRYTRFGMVADDFNNDGWLDLFEANGAVSRSSKRHEGDRFAEPNSLYFGTADGKFSFIEHTEDIHTSRGAAIGDIDNDGALDLLVTDLDESVKLMMNDSPALGSWLVLDIRDELGRPALGANVSLKVGDRTLNRVVQSASSYLSARDPRLHFGLGARDSVSAVRVRWLSGRARQFESLAANQILVIHENEG